MNAWDLLLFLQMSLLTGQSVADQGRLGENPLCNLGIFTAKSAIEFTF